MTIDLGQAGSFEVALSGTAMSVPTGYQQYFEVENKTLPEHWTGWMVKSAYDYNSGGYVYESAEEGLDYFVGTTIDNVKAISIKDSSNPVRSYPNQYEIYMISPKVSGNAMITARSTSSSSYITPRVKLYKATAENGSFTIGDEINVTWVTELNSSDWSQGIFSISEGTQIAVLMDYAAVSAFATDNVEIKVAEIGDEFTENGLTYIVKSATEVGVTGVSNDVTECVVPEKTSYCGSHFNVVSIERDAFYWSNVTSVSLPSTLTTIGYGAFRSSSLATVNIPESVTTIGYGAFGRCVKLESVTIPKNVNYIGNFAFNSFDSKLTEIICLPTEPPILEGNDVFTRSNSATLQVPRGSVEKYKASDWNNYFSRIEEIDD